MLSSLWFLNMVFSVIAAPVVLRYQVFQSVISLGLSILLVEKIYGLEGLERQTKNPH